MAVHLVAKACVSAKETPAAHFPACNNNNDGQLRDGESAIFLECPPEAN